MSASTNRSICLLLVTFSTFAVRAEQSVGVSLNEGAIPGAADNAVQVDQLAGRYNERFTEDSIRQTFASTAVFVGGQWLSGASTASTQLNGLTGSGYSIYVKFSAVGTSVTGTLGFTAPSWTATAGAVEIWADPEQDTVYSVPATTSGKIDDLLLSSGARSTSDDLLLASSTAFASGSGASGYRINPGYSNLAFGSFVLTSAGMSYLSMPMSATFGLALTGSFIGQLTSPVGGSPLGINEYFFDNSGSLSFTSAVPEPASWVLLVVGAAMVIGVRRRTT